MTLLQRYVLRDVLSASSMVFLLFAFVLFYGNATRHDEYFLKALFLSAETFFLLSGLLVPYVLSYALPLGLMAGILLSFGRLS
ncbi:MAG: LptF/LptG family permease, partial [Opitutales bacterium]